MKIAVSVHVTDYTLCKQYQKRTVSKHEIRSKNQKATLEGFGQQSWKMGKSAMDYVASWPSIVPTNYMSCATDQSQLMSAVNLALSVPVRRYPNRFTICT